MLFLKTTETKPCVHDCDLSIRGGRARRIQEIPPPLYLKKKEGRKLKLTRSRRELVIMVGNGETFTSVTVARETWICHVSIFALDTGQLRAKLYATHSLKSSLLKSCSNDPPSTHISLFILSLYLYDFLV